MQSKTYLVWLSRKHTRSTIELIEEVKWETQAGFCPRLYVLHKLKGMYPGWDVKIAGTIVKEKKE